MTRELIDLKPLQELVAESGVSHTELARRLGWMRMKRTRWGGTYITGDGSRVARTLGLVDQQPGGRRVHRPGRCRNRRIGVEQAQRIADALDLDPVDVGL
jgi:hypothetical protein